MTDNSNRTDLFTPVTMGGIELANRIVMAPVTRSRYGETASLTKCTPSITHSVPLPA